jgi:TATA-box binding protein (TBP) (component of TFIID and TFIIIB)
MNIKKAFSITFIIGSLILSSLIDFKSSVAGNVVTVCVDGSNIADTQFINQMIKDISKKSNAKVCFVGGSKNDLKFFKNANSLKDASQSDLNSADIVFVKNLKSTININKPAFALDCQSFKHCPNCFGVLYWRNGRAMVMIFEERLRKLGLKLPSSYNSYIDSEQYSPCR